MSSHSGKMYGDSVSLPRHSVVSIPRDDSSNSLPRATSTALPRDDSNSSLSTNDSHGNMTCYRGYTSRRKSLASMDPRLPDSEGNPNIPSPEGHSSRKSSREERDCGKRRSSRDEVCHHRRAPPSDSRDDLHYRGHHHGDDGRGHHHGDRGHYHSDDTRSRHGDRVRRHHHRNDDTCHHDYGDDMRSYHGDDGDDYGMYYHGERRRSSSCKERRRERPRRDTSPDSMYDTMPSKGHGSGSDSYHSSVPSRESKPRPRKSSAFTHETQRSFSSQDIRPNMREHHRSRAPNRNIEHTTRTRSNGSIRSLDSKHSRDGQSDYTRSGGRRGGHDSERGQSHDRISYGSDSERGRPRDHIVHHGKESDSERGRSRDNMVHHGKESDRSRSHDSRQRDTDSRRRVSRDHSLELELPPRFDKEFGRECPPRRESTPVDRERALLRERPPPPLRQRKSASDMLQVRLKNVSRENRP